MNDPVLLLVNYFLVFVESMSLIFFCECFFAKRLNTIKFICATLILTPLNFIALSISDWNVFLKILLLACVNVVWIHIAFSSSVIKCAVTSIIFVSLMNLIDSLFFIGTSIVMNIDTQEWLQDPYVYYLFCYFSKCFGLIGILVLRLFIKQHFRFEKITWQNWLRVSVLPITSLVIAVFLWRLYWIAPFAAKDLLLCTVVLLIMDMFIVVFLNYLNEQEQLRQDNVILKNNVKFQNEMITTWSDAYKSQRKMTHDFQNQLSVICGLAEREAPNSQLLSYTKTLLKGDTGSSIVVKTGRQVVDVLFSQKCSISREKGIEFCMQLDDLTSFSVSDEYLVVLLSNLIDNAIEACERIPEGYSKKITVKMRVADDESFLYIENNTLEPVKILNNQVVVLQKHSIEHGYGLRTVANILNQYHAVFAISYREEDKMFCFSAQIPQAL